MNLFRAAFIVFISCVSAYGAAVPDVAISGTTSPFIGDPLTFTLTFTNMSPDTTGYGPYIDLVLPATGADGYDGITITSADYSGAAISPIILTFDASGNVTHPYARDSSGQPVIINKSMFSGIKNGDNLVVLQLPFGSFTPTQPAALVTVHAQLSNLADVSTPLPVYVRGGFQFGNDPLDNPSTDPSITGGNNTLSVSPIILTLNETNDAPESETATGPNFPRKFSIDVDIATGQKLTYADITANLPNNLQFVSLVSVVTHFPQTSTFSVTQTPSITIPGGTLAVHITPTGGPTQFTAVNGTDATLTFMAYVPRLDVSSAAILPAVTGASNVSKNDAIASINWIPIDTNDPTTVVTSNVTPIDNTLADKSIAIQKSNTLAIDANYPGPTPGDTLEYTLNIQVSDYFAFQNIIINDLISDGQNIDPGFQPTLAYSAHGINSAASAFAVANWTATVDTMVSGKTSLQFRVSAEAIARGLASGQFLGGGIPNGGTGAGPLPNLPPIPFGATTLQIVYRTKILDKFLKDFPSGEDSLNAHDVLTNVVQVSGDVLNVTNLTPTGNTATDGSSSSVEIAASALVKTIVAVNGNPPPTPLVILPGDTLTYRLQYTLPTGDVENLIVRDFLPLPIFKAGDPLANHIVTPWVFDDSVVMDNTPPAAGHGKFGIGETLRNRIGHPPVISTDTALGNNTLLFTYGTYSNIPNDTLFVDLLFTVTVTDDPFADDLFLTNQAQTEENSTQQPAVPINDNKIVQVHVGSPGLTPIYKGVVSYRNTQLTLGGLTFLDPVSAAPNFSGTPNAHGGLLTLPAQAAAIGSSDLLGGLVDAGDTVRFAVVLQNEGHGDAYNVKLSDTYPAGLQVPVPSGLRLTLKRGDGTTMILNTDYTATTTAAGFSISLIDNYAKGPGTGLGGINRGIDGSNTALDDGSNAIIILYDLQVASANASSARSIIVNKATLTNYTSTPTGPNFATDGVSDTAQVEIAKASVTKTLISTSLSTTGNDAGSQATIGETVTYQLEVTVPEGITRGAKIVDTLPAGMAYSSLLSFTPSPATITASNSVTVAGQVVTFNLGDITDPNFTANNAIADKITIQYSCLVQDVLGNQAGNTLSNSAVFSHTWLDAMGATQTFTQTPQTALVTVVEPTLTVAETISPDNVSYSNSLTGVDAGDTVYYKIVINNNNAASDTIAYNLNLSSALPSQLQSPTIFTVTAAGSYLISGAPGTPNAGSFGFTGNTLNQVSTIDILPNSTLTILISGTLDNTVQPGQSLANAVASIKWQSLPAPSTGRFGSRTAPTNTNDSSDNTRLDNYDATSDVSACTILNPVPAKKLVTQSESHVVANEVYIGEIVRYQLLWQIPEGISNNLVLTDNLPAGLQYVNGSVGNETTMLAFISNPANKISSSTISGVGLNVLGDQTTVSGIHPTFKLPAAAISVVGGKPVFTLGNVTNSANNTNVEYVMIEFNALVKNVAGNQAFNNSTGANSATPLDNTLTVTTNTPSTQTSTPAVTVRVAEPLITNLTKTITTTPTDAGDTIVYQLTFSNVPGSNTQDRAPAFNVRFLDTVDSSLTVTGVVITPATGSTVTDNSSGNTVDFTLDKLDPTTDILTLPTGVKVVITATVNATDAAALTIPNTNATVTYTSLPGVNGTLGNSTGENAPGASGTATGKRDGSGGVNDYTVSKSVNVTLGKPSVDARYANGLVAPANGDTSNSSSTGKSIVPGESAMFDILVKLTEGLNKHIVVNYALPSGLRFDPTFNGNVGYQLFTNPATCNNQFPGIFGAGLAVNTLTAPGGNGVGVSFDFGDVTLPATSGTANTSFVIRMQVIATDVLTNRTGQNLVGTATLNYTNPNNGSTATVNDSNTLNDPQFTIVEPILTVVKTVSTPAADAGDPLTYTITIANASGLTAYDVTLNDVLPADLTFPNIGSVTGPGTFNITGSTLASIVPFDLPTGSSTVITVSGSLSTSVSPGQTISNTAQVFWTSMPGSNTDERTSADVPNPTLGTIDLSKLNNYAIASSVATTSVSQVIVSKAIVGTSEPSTSNANVTIGEKITYRLTVSVPEGTINNFQITDNIPTGQAYLAGTIALSAFRPANIHAMHPGTGTGAFAGVVGAPTEAGGAFLNGTAVLFNFGSITNPGNNNLNDNTFSFTYQTLVLDVAGNVGLNAGPQTTMTNSGTSKILPSGASSAILVDPTNIPNTFGVVATVVEPRLTVAQTLSSATGDAGDIITFTLVVAHGPNSKSDAFDVSLTDVLPAGFVFVPNSGTNTAGVAPSSIGAASPSFSWTGANSIPVGSTSTVTFQATLAQSVTPGQVLTSAPQVAWTTLPGPNTNLSVDVIDGTDQERTRSATDSDTCTVPGGVFSKALFTTSEPSTLDPNVTIGETVTYALVVTLPEGTTPDLTIVDHVPAGMHGVSFSLVTTAAASGGLMSADFNGTVPAPTVNFSAGAGNDSSFVFGSISVTGESIANSNNSFVVLLTAMVKNVVGNSGLTPPGQTTLANTATFSGTTLGTFTTPPVNVTVVEPKLTVTKTCTPNIADADDTITIALSVKNVGTSTSFNTNVHDVLNIAKFDPNTVALGVAGTAYPAAYTASVNTATGEVLYTGGTIAVNATDTFTFTVKLTKTVIPGEVITNTASQIQSQTTPVVNGDTRTEPNSSGSDTVTIRTNSIAGTVFHDINNDGNINGADAGLVGVTVTLTGTDRFGNAVNKSAVTIAGGTYTISNIPPGTFTLVATHPAGYLDGKDKAGSLGGTAGGFGSNTISAITFPAGASNNATAYNFGEILPSSLAGTVYDDKNSNHILDGGDTGINGVTVTLTGTDDTGTTINVGTTTSGGGAYSFPNLRPGTYTITKTPPAGYVTFYNTVGTQASGTVAAPPSEVISTITLNENTNGTGNNFGEHALASVAGFVYNDANNNGTKNPGEFGIPSVQITLTGTDDLGGAVSLSTTTDNAGAFSFSNLRPGNYVLTEPTQPLSYTSGINTPGTSGGVSATGPDTLTFTLGDGANATGYLFGEIYSANPVKTTPSTTVTIGDVVHYRLVANLPRGTVNSLELRDNLPAGMAFINDGSAKVAFVSTAGTGAISSTAVSAEAADPFAGVVPSVSLPDASVSNASASNTDVYGSGTPVFFKFGNVTDTEIDASAEHVIVEFNALVLDVPGNFGGFVLSNTFTVRYDKDGTGPSDLITSPPVSVTVVEPIMSITKNITQLVADAADTLTVNLTVKNTGTSPSYDTVVQDILNTAKFKPATVAFGTSGVDYPAGYTPTVNTGTGEILYSGGTVPVGGTQTFVFTVQLTNSVLPAEVISNTATVIQATTLPGTVTGERNEPPVNGSDTVTIRSNSLAGIVFHDINNDGTENGADAGLFNVTVTLTGTDHLGVSVNMTTTTLADGSYSFPLLRPGTYAITATHPAGYFDGKSTAGTAGGTAGGFNSNQISTITLPLGTSTSGTAYNFGEILPSLLSGFVYDDKNSSHSFDGGDVGLDGVTVALNGTDDAGVPVSASTTTSGGGAYSFTNLRPGLYTITKTPPAGYFDFYNTVGTQGSGNVFAPPSEVIQNIALNENTSGSGNNFGEHQIASVAGFVYNDANNNGAKNPGEFGIPAVTITLTGTDDIGGTVSLSTTTDSTGAYSFTNLRPGNYVLTEPTQPLSYTSGINTPGTAGGVAGPAPDTITFTLPDGSAATTYLFGEIYAPNPVKSTPSTTVTVGDVVHYRLVANLPRGTVNSLEFRDNLPAGMAFINDGSAKVAFVSTAGSGKITSTAVSAEAADPFAGVVPSVALPDTSVSNASATNTDAYGSGTPVFFKFGNVTDTENDASAEHVIVEFNARVLDVAAATRGNLLTNTFTVRYDKDGTGPTDDVTSPPVSVTVIEPTLTVTKLASNHTPHLGYPVTYTMTITHTAASNATAYDLYVADTLPPELTLNVASIAVTGPAILSNTSAGNSIALHLDTLAVGSSATITYSALVTSNTASFGANIDNNVRIYWDSQATDFGSNGVQTPPLDSNPERDYGATGLDNPFNNQIDPAQYTERITITGPGLSLTKDDGQTVVVAGQVLTYEITVKNAGTDIANNVTITDTIPANTTFVTASTGFAFAAGVVTWSNQTLAAGATAPAGTYSVTVQINPTLPPNVFTITNTATGTLAPGEIDPTPGDNTATDVDNLNAVPDLKIVKTANSPSILPGQTIVFTLTYSNVGTRDATGVVLNETVPVRTVYATTGSTPGWSYTAGDIPGTAGTISIGNLAAGASGTVTIAFTVDASVPVGFTQIDNTATINDDGSGGPDANPLDNTSSASTHIPSVDLSLTKVVDKPKLSKVDVGTFTIEVTNSGPDDATNLVVSDPLPAGLKLVSAVPGQGTYTASSGVWNVGALGAGETATLTIGANLTVGQPVTNVATITGSDQYDPTPDNNTGSATVSPLLADLQIVKTVAPEVVSYGTNAVYTIVLTNLGPDTATSVVVNDVLPEGLTFVSFDSTQGQYNVSDGNWGVGTLLNGASATLTITVQVLSDVPVDNTATVTYEDQFDPNLLNNTSTATLTPLHAGISIVKTVDNEFPELGDTITYTITVKNAGPGNAPNIQVTEQMPAGVKLGTFTASQGTYDAATSIWTIGTIANGASVTLSLQATVTDEGSIQNTASLVPSTATSSTPVTSSSVSTVTSKSMKTSCFSVAFNLAKPNHDRLLFTTLCTLPKTFNPNGQTLAFSLGGLSYSCVLNQHGQSKNGTHVAQMRLTPQGWVALLRITNDDLKVIKGYENADVKSEQVKDVLLRVDVGGKTFVNRDIRIYSAKQNKTGKMH